MLPTRTEQNKPELSNVGVALGERKKPRRPKGKSPTARTLDECKKRGWPAGVVERYIAPIHKRVDLFGVIDLIAITPSGILGIQATGQQTGSSKASGDHGHSDHRKKILAEPRARQWLEAGGMLELWTWSKRGAIGKAKRWSARVEVFSVDHFDVVVEDDFG